MANVLNWIKANLVIVIFVVLMIAALIALPLVASGLNAAVKKDVQDRLAKNKKLEAAEKVTVDLDGGPVTILPHEELLRQYREHASQRDDDARQLREIAVNHNRKDRGLILPALFPVPPETKGEVLPAEFQRLLAAAYDALLKEIRAGSPPPPEVVAAALDQAEAKFRVDTLRKGEKDALTADEATQLRNELTTVRLNEYARAAETIGLYVNTAVINVPGWQQDVMPPPTTLFDWQWQFWITEDILRALADVNAGATSVANAPVKRVAMLRVLDPLPTGGGPAQPAGRTGGRGGRSAPPDEDGAAAGGDEDEDGGAAPARPAPGRRAASGRTPAPGGAPASSPPAAPHVDVAREAPLDYRVSFTGRTSNHLYDVRFVQLRLIVETAKVPQVMKALAQRNFITILDATVRPGSAFDGIRNGYFYGDAPVSELNLELETIWLREWTVPFMPPGLRAALGIAAPPAAG